MLRVINRMAWLFAMLGGLCVSLVALMTVVSITGRAATWSTETAPPLLCSSNSERGRPNRRSCSSSALRCCGMVVGIPFCASCSLMVPFRPSAEEPLSPQM